MVKSPPAHEDAHGSSEDFLLVEGELDPLVPNLRHVQLKPLVDSLLRGYERLAGSSGAASGPCARTP